MTELFLPGFVGGTLDRADAIRNDPARAAAAFSDPTARLLLLDGIDPVANGERLATGPIPADADLRAHALLGFDADGPHFVGLTDKAPAADSMMKVWGLVSLLTRSELAHYGAARSLVDWHRRHRFCAACGATTCPEKAGWSRRCGSCDAEHFPRVDPVTIMLAEHGGRVLIGLQARFPGRHYSALAGFVEPGETIEEAVARELHEEAGIRVDKVRYVLSQPWPFPSSLMIGCIAEALDDALTIDTTELEHAMWVDADAVRAALNGDEDAPFTVPPPIAVAHSLFRYWLDEQ